MEAPFGSASSEVPIYLDDVQCSGQEHQLITCPAQPIGVNNCGHHEDAGVRCQPSDRVRNLSYLLFL